MKETSTYSKTMKILALTLALALLLGMSMIAVAEEPVTEPPVEENPGDGVLGIESTMGTFDSDFGFGGDISSCDDCNDADCPDCNPCLCDDCGEDMMTCLCCAACDSQGCSFCDPSLYDCGDCGICYVCNIDDENFTPPIEETSASLNVANSTQLSSALSLIADGGVINITASFTYASPIVIDGISVELNLGANTLTLETNAFATMGTLGIHNAATLNVTGTGTLNVLQSTGMASRNVIYVNEGTLNNNGAIINATGFGGSFALYVVNGTATITNVTNGHISASDGSNVTVNGNVTGGISSSGGAKVTVNGNVDGSAWAEGVGTIVTVNGNVSEWVNSADGATMTVNGNMTNTASAWGGTLTVNGNITGNNVYGVTSSDNGTVTVNGNISLTGTESVGVALDVGNNSVTVNGTISAAVYIAVGWGPDRISLTTDQYDAIVERGGQSYRQFITKYGNVFVRAGAIITPSLTESTVNAAISANEPLVLTGADTTISAEVLQAIKASEGTLNIILPNGVHISINAAQIGPNAQPIDLNIVLTPTTTATTVGGAAVPANSLIIAPETHGAFGFTINIHVPHAQLTAAGLGSGNLNLYYVAGDGTVTNLGAVQRQSDGSVIVSISHASHYYLWSPPQVLQGRSPQTGDERSITIAIIMLVLGVAGLGGWVLYTKRIKKTAE